MGATETKPLSSTPLVQKHEFPWLNELYQMIPPADYDCQGLNSAFITEYLKIKPGDIIATSIGEQSLGKSYLLNKLFDANFRTKVTYDEGKCTMNMNSQNKNDLHLMDFEGFDSNDNTIKRDNTNVSLAFAFSHIILLHIEHKKLDSRFIERFAFSYWLAIKKMKYNGIKLPKIVMLIRDPKINRNFDDSQNYLQMETSINAFREKVNQNLNVYNRKLAEIISKDKKIPNKEEIIANVVPNDPEYEFTYSFFYIVHWDPMAEEYKSRKNNKYVDFDNNDFLHLFNIIKTETRKVIGLQVKEDITLDERINNNLNLQEEYRVILDNLRLSKISLERYLEDIKINEQFVREYCLSIELDHHYNCTNFTQLSLTMEHLDTISHNLKKEDKKNLRLSNNSQGNILENKAKHSKFLQDKFSLILESETKVKVLESLIADSAFNYNKYLGFTISSLMGNERRISNGSLRDISMIFRKFTNSNEENFLVFVLEVILKYSGPDYERLIDNEFNKILKVRNHFKSLCYYEKTEKFYIEKYQRLKIRNFFTIIFCYLNERIDKMFSAEINWQTNFISIEETEKKINMIDWNMMKLKITILIRTLELPIINEFNGFYDLLKDYFQRYIKMIVWEAKSKYFEVNQEKLIYFERSHPLIKESINISTVSVGAAMLTGHLIRAANVIFSAMQIVGTALSWSSLVAEFGLGIVITGTGITAAILAVPFVAGTFLVKYGSRKLAVYRGTRGEFCDYFRVGTELDNNLNIITVDVKEVRRNCDYEKNYPKATKKSSTHYYNESVLIRSNDNSLSALVYFEYSIKVTKNDRTVSSQINANDIDRRVNFLLRR